MPLPVIQLGSLSVSRFILGGNPFSGFSHQNPETDRAMVRYFTTAQIKRTLHQAEELGVTTFIGRADRHIARVLAEYWDEGGQIRWIAQTCPEFGSPLTGARAAVSAGAAAVYLHGGQMDFLYAQGRLNEAEEAIAWIKSTGRPVGIAAHKPEVHAWANDALSDLDFHMCSYYNPTPRDQHAAHIAGAVEVFDPLDRQRMVETIQCLRRPAIHYKIFAAGRTPPDEAFSFAARHLRPQDAVCAGVYPKDNPNMLAEDLDLFLKSLESNS